MTEVATPVEDQLDRTKEVTISITESNNKIYESSLYDKAVNNPIHGRKWREAIEKELQNLENHQTYEYDEFSSRQKAIGLKWVFKVKYHPNDSVTRFKVKFVT